MARTKFAESAYSFAAQWPYLRYLGMGAWWAWIWLCYNSTEVMRFFPIEQRTTYVLTMYICSTIGIASMMLLAAFLWRKSTVLIRRRSFVIGFGILAVISTLCIGYAAFLGGRITFIIAAFLSGVGTSALCLRCGDIYGSIALKESITAGSVSLIFACFLYFMGIGLPASWHIAFVSLMPLASALLLTMPGDDPYPAADEQILTTKGKPVGRRTYIKLVIASAAVAFTADVGKGISSTMVTSDAFALIGTVTTFIIAIFAGIVIWMINAGDIVKSTRRVYSLLMLFGVVVLLAAFLGLDLSYLSIGKEALWMVFSCLMAYMAFRFDYSPIRAFGYGQAAYFIFSTLGWVIGSMVPRFMDATYARMFICILFAFIIVLLLTFVFTDADLKFILTWRENGPSKPTTEGDDAPTSRVPYGPAEGTSSGEGEGVPEGLPLSQAIARIDPSYGLSSRELEVLELFAQGRSANWIADDLTVSKNTVRSHLRSIYVKLDIHSRQELLDFLNRL